MIKSEKEYTAIINRIEDLLSVPQNIENPEAKGIRGAESPFRFGGGI